MTEYLSRRTGFAIVCAIVAVTAVWLATRGKEALQPIAKTPALMQSKDLDRFRADAWFLPNESLLGFVKIPAGRFLMGSRPNPALPPYANEQWSSESEQGTVELPEYYMGRYEVTVAQFRAFVAATGYKFPSNVLLEPPTRPIARVKWTDALAYARWLDRQLRDAKDIAPELVERLQNGWHVALPSEAEWEKAARGVDGRLFPWGDSPDNHNANFAGTDTIDVGSRRCVECAFQLADMSGNVWEMTRSPNVPYPFNETKRGDPNGYPLYVMRGGAYNDTPQNARAAVRGAVDTDTRSQTIGFRVVIVK